MVSNISRVLWQILGVCYWFTLCEGVCRKGSFSAANYTIRYDTANNQVYLIVVPSMSQCTSGSDCYEHILHIDPTSKVTELDSKFKLKLNESAPQTVSSTFQTSIFSEIKSCASNNTYTSDTTIAFNSDVEGNMRYEVYYAAASCSDSDTPCEEDEDIGCCLTFEKPTVSNEEDNQILENVNMTIKRDIDFRGGITPPFVCKSGSDSNLEKCLETFRPITMFEGDEVIMAILICTKDCVNDQDNIDYSHYSVDDNNTVISFYRPGMEALNTTATVTNIEDTNISSQLSGESIAFKFNVPALPGCEGTYCTAKINVTILNVFEVYNRRLRSSTAEIFGGGSYEFNVRGGPRNNDDKKRRTRVSFQIKQNVLPNVQTPGNVGEGQMINAVEYCTSALVEKQWKSSSGTLNFEIHTDMQASAIKLRLKSSGYLMNLIDASTLTVVYSMDEENSTFTNGNDIYGLSDKNNHESHKVWMLPIGALLIVGTLGTAIIFKRRERAVHPHVQSNPKKIVEQCHQMT